MTLEDTRSRRGSPSAPRATLTAVGVLFVLAGIVMPFGEVVALLGPSGRSILPVWAVLLHPVGAVLFLVGSVLLAVGVRGEDGFVGRARGPRAALIVSGLIPLLLVGVYVTAFGSAVIAVYYAFEGLLLLCVAAAVVVAVRILRAGRVTGPARWSWVVLAVLGVLMVIGALVPPVSVLLNVGAVIVLPAAIVVAGVLLLLGGRGRPERVDG